jgi:hypothetical protein
MRRLPAFVLTALLGGLLLAPGLWVMQQPARRAIAIARTLGRMACPRAALAQETMQFHPVPPESAAMLERERLRRGRISHIRIEGPDTVAVPVVPTPGNPPEAMHPTMVSRSGDITRVGSDIHIEQGEVVQGDVLAIGGDVIVDGHVEGSVTAMRGNVILNSTARVDDDVAAIGGELREEPGSFVGGEKVTAGTGRDRSARIHRLTRHTMDTAERSAARVVTSLLWMLIVVGVAWALAHFAPGRTGAAIETLKRDATASLGIGGLLLALIIPSVFALCIVMVLLAVTIIGIPLMLAVIIGYVAFFILYGVFGFVVGAATLGERLASRNSTTPVTITKAAVWGAAAVSGLSVVGHMLRAMGPLSGLGVLVLVIHWIVFALVVTYGGGAWLRSEFATGTFGRWWAGRKRGPSHMMPPGPGTPAPAAPAAPAASAVVAAPPATSWPPPSPPEAFAPPPTPEPPSES